MDCCSHEGRTVGDARFEIKKVADVAILCDGGCALKGVLDSVPRRTLQWS